MLLGVLVGAWVARYLGPANFGELAYVLAYIAFFQAIANLGADGVIVRDIAQDKSTAPLVLGTAFVLRLAIGLACWFLAIGGMVWSNGIGDQTVILTALAGGVLVFQAADTIDLWFQSQSQSRRTVVAKLIAYGIANAIKIALILMQAPLIAFAAVMALDALIAAMGLAVAYKSFSTEGDWHHAANQAKTLLRESWPYMLSGVSITVYMRIDQIMLKNMLGEQALGLYAAALPLSQVWHFIPMTLAISFAPFLARKKSQSEHAYMHALGIIFRLFSGFALVVCLATAIFSSVAIRYLYGAAFSEAGSVLAIHVFTNVFISLGVAQSMWLINESLPRLSLYKTIIGVAVSVLGNFLLIPHLGIWGAAIVAVMAQFISAFASNIVFAPEIFRIQLYSIFQINAHRTISVA